MGDPLAYIRAVHFAATIVATGVVVFEIIVAAPAFVIVGGALDPDMARLRRRWSWLVWVALGTAVVSGAIWLVVLAADIYSAPIGEVWRAGGVWTVATETRFGQVSLARLAGAAGLAVSLPMLRRRSNRALWRAGALVLATGMMIGPAFIGHAGGTPGTAGEFPLAADVVHLLAAGVWVGGLPPLAMLLAAAACGKQPHWAIVAAAAVRKFSLLGVISVSGLVASGIVNSWYEVGTLANLVTTAYGRLVVIKIALFAGMLALASVNRFYLTPRLATAGTIRRLCHTSLSESTLGFAAIVVVGFLGAMAPASHAHHNAAIPKDAAFVHIHSNAGMADVTIMPGRVGTARAIIRLWSDNFEPLAAAGLTLTLTPPGEQPIASRAAQAQDGSWEVDVVPLSQPGNWKAAIEVTLADRRRLLLDAPIVIEPGD